MYQAARDTMVSDQIAARGVRDPRVLAAMRAVPRERFVPASLRARAHDDNPLAIGHGQTISQPYIVALMTELASPRPGDRVLDVGTGSGYQAAVLAQLVDHVDSIEILCPLADEARARLADLGMTNIEVRCGDGWAGWPERAPFDVIIVAAAPEQVPPALLEQLAPGGRLVIPVGGKDQVLRVVTKALDGTLVERAVGGVRFVPMTGGSAPASSGD